MPRVRPPYDNYVHPVGPVCQSMKCSHVSCWQLTLDYIWWVHDPSTPDYVPFKFPYIKIKENF